MDDLLVKLQIYEGPLDLLLHLIRKNEVNINDIPVALITSQYLEYLDLMEKMNVEVAGDFLLMAATLAQIKSRLLLPGASAEEEEEVAEELKAAIVDPLLEHLKFKGFKDVKDAALVLQARPILDHDVFVRGQSQLEQSELETPELAADNLVEASLFDLVESFRRLAEKKKKNKSLRFLVETKTIEERLKEIQDFLKSKPTSTFAELCQNDRGINELILSFLATLELARTGFLKLYQNLKSSPDLRLFLANPEADLSALGELTY